MTKRIVITPKASADLDEHFEYLVQYNVEAALNFFDAARQTFAQIARTPGIGSPYIAKKIKPCRGCEDGQSKVLMPS